MATHQLPYVCGGICGVDACPQDFNSEKELTMHCINEDETQVHTKRPFCDQCFTIFDEMDNPGVHECDVGKAQAQISMALSQCDTTIIDLTLGGNGDYLCSFRNEDWFLSSAPKSADTSKRDSSSSEEGFLDDTIIPAAAAKKRRSVEDPNPVESKRKSPRIEAQQREAVLSPKPTKQKSSHPPESAFMAHGDLDNVVIAGSFQNKKPILSPVRFVPESIQTSSVIKQSIPLIIPRNKQKNRTVERRKIDKSVISTIEMHLPVKSSVNVPIPKAQSNQKATQKIAPVPDKGTQGTAAQIGQTNVDKTVALENVGIFWDIENITIPPNVSVSLLVRKLRNTFVTMDKREVEFMCVCDVHKEKKYVIDDLNSCNVTIVHVNCYAKNAADEKLKHYLSRFAQTYAAPSTVVLLSGDVNFNHQLSNLNRFYGLNTVLIHNPQCSDFLKQHASRTILFEDFIKGIGPPQKSTQYKPSFLVVDNLPIPQISYSEVYNKLDCLIDNTGGKIVNINGGVGLIRFSNMELRLRAQKRLQGYKFRHWLPPIVARFSHGTVNNFR